MTELKGKLVDTIKDIDFAKLNIYELKNVVEILEVVDRLEAKSPFCSLGTPAAPKTIGELKEN